MKKRMRSKRGQAMVEYIIIVVLIAITLIVLFGKFGKAIGTKVAGAAESLDENVDAAAEVDKIDENSIKKLGKEGI